MVGRIPEGTRRRHRTTSLENPNSCGIRTRTNTDFRGSDRVMASSEDREILDDD